MRKCKTCKWWRKPSWSESDWGSCALTESDMGTPVYRHSKAHAFDTDEYYSILKTHKDFGCVQWEPQGEDA